MIQTQSALIMIDIQNDFCSGGALAVPEGEVIIDQVNHLQAKFSSLVLTQDWHPDNHQSFHDNHEGKEPFSLVTMPYGDQVLWPRHCVQGSDGAQFHEKLETRRADVIIRKGQRPEIDSYSAFFENDRQTPTGLNGYLRERNIDTLYLVGLATDFCVYYSAIDAIGLGYQVFLLEDCCRAINLEGSLDKAMRDMSAQGVNITHSQAI